jgi:hypothetical protein
VPTSALSNLVTLADQQVQAGNYFTATLYYEAYVQQNPNDGAVQLKLAKAILQGPTPNYTEAQRALQQAASLPGSWQQEAQTLLTQIQPTVAASIPTITGTKTLTGTALPATSGTSVPSDLAPTPTSPVTR